MNPSVNPDAVGKADTLQDCSVRMMMAARGVWSVCWCVCVCVCVCVCPVASCVEVRESVSCSTPVSHIVFSSSYSKKPCLGSTRRYHGAIGSAAVAARGMACDCHTGGHVARPGGPQ